MKKATISQDDLIDVMEMTSKVESYMNNVFEGNEQSLCISALMSATINCLLKQCYSKEEFVIYRNVYVDLLDNMTKSIEAIE